MPILPGFPATGQVSKGSVLFVERGHARGWKLDTPESAAGTDLKGMWQITFDLGLVEMNAD